MHEPALACSSCSGTVLRKIGEDVTEVLEYVPSSFKVMEHVRPKLSCRTCATILQAPLPSFPIERGRAGPALLAHVVVAKFADALPLHRQTAIYQRAGVDLDRSTMADWVGSMAALIDPLYEAIGVHARRGEVHFADDTTVPVLAPGKGRTDTGRLWVVLRDEAPWCGSAPPAAFYRYSRDRKAEQAEALLGTCRGFLHADGYAGFKGLYEGDPKSRRAASDRGCMLESRAPQNLRRACRHRVSAGEGGAGADRGVVCNRGRHQRPTTSRAPCCAGGSISSTARRTRTVFASRTQPDQRQEHARRSDPLRAVTVGRAHALHM